MSASSALFAKYLTVDVKVRQFFCLKGYIKKHNIPLWNITAVATDNALATVSRYRKFAALLQENVPNVRTFHCVLHVTQLVAKKLSSELHDLKVCIKSINKIKARPLKTKIKMMKIGTNYFCTLR